MAKRNKGINIFRHVPKADVPRTKFNMNHSVKFDGDFGVAYPFFAQDVLAGDTWSVACQHFARMAPMIAPVLHDFDVHFHWFYVPTRLLWDDFEDWYTGGNRGTWREENPDAFPVFTLTDAMGLLPSVASADSFQGSIFDYFGLNFSSDSTNSDLVSAADMQNSMWKFSVLPLRAYWMIYNYFFRDQNVMNELEISTNSGFDNLSWLISHDAFDPQAKGLFRVAWDKDYFTSATLTPQRGPQVFVPIGDTAIVYPSQNNIDVSVNEVRGLNTSGQLNASYVGAGKGLIQVGSGTNVTLNGTAELPSLTANLSTASGAAVSDVREAFALQRFFERLQITGSRFQEYLRGVFGTDPGDARLQMPEYLGGWSNPFIINNVSNTAGIDGERPQGSYAGNGLSSQHNSPIVKNFPEPGYLIGLYMILPKPAYQQGVSKLLTRIDWFDHYNPYFEHIGEQPIMTSELFFDPKVSPLQDKIFGYQSQYASYKFINSHTHGKMKQELDFWTATREFSEEPTLSKEFIEYDNSEGAERCFALPNEPKFYIELKMFVEAERPLSVFSTPKLIG